MDGLNGFGAVEIGDGAGHAQNAVVGAGSETHFFKGVLHQCFAGCVQGTELRQHGRRHMGVAGNFCAGKACTLACAGGVYPCAHSGTVLGGLFAAHGFIFYTGHTDVQVNAVQQRTGDAGNVLLHLGTGAGAAAGGVAVPSAAAGVHGAHQHKAAGQAQRARGPGDGHFAVFKGLKSILADNAVVQLIDNHLPTALFICWVVCSLLLFFIQRFKINILRITILSGTFALALAFAGNDLVNFIGVPVAGFDAYSIAREAGDTQMLMGALNENVPANFLILLAAGILMIVTLWTSKKAMHVSETEISLSAQDDGGQQQYGSSVFSRTIVRAALNVSAGIERVVPKHLREAISRRFEYEDVEHSGAPYDMIRATVNLTTSALLIAMATSLKLPLSTTYVCFMVAMGSSLADRAWGRESAVYRISGVMTVVAGWFITALGGFLIAFVVGLTLIYGGTPIFIVITLLCGWMLVHSNFLKKNKESNIVKEQAETKEDIIANLRDEVCRTMECATKIYDRTLIAVFKENRKVLRDMVKESNDLFYQSRERKYSLLPTLKKLQGGDVNTAHYYVQVVDYLNEMTKALMHITRPAFEHIDNNHEGLSKEQAKDLMAINDDVESIYRHINLMLRDGDFSEIETVLTMRDQLFESIADAIKSELTRINEARSNTKASMLYLTILTETKNMVLQSRNLLKSQQYFLKHLTGPKTWIK